MSENLFVWQLSAAGSSSGGSERKDICFGFEKRAFPESSLICSWQMHKVGTMMVREGDYLAVFNSIHRVMQAEKRLKERCLPILLIPAPRSLKSDCGLALRYAAEDRGVVEEAFSVEGLIPEEVYQKISERFIRVDEVISGSSKED